MVWGVYYCVMSFMCSSVISTFSAWWVLTHCGVHSLLSSVVPQTQIFCHEDQAKVISWDEVRHSLHTICRETCDLKLWNVMSQTKWQQNVGKKGGEREKKGEIEKERYHKSVHTWCLYIYVHTMTAKQIIHTIIPTWTTLLLCSLLCALSWFGTGKYIHQLFSSTSN